MTIVFESVIDFLEKFGLMKTARVMRKELKVQNGIILDSDKELHLLSTYRPKYLSLKLILHPNRTYSRRHHQKRARALETH
jgi:hypothetical protein